MFTNRQRTAREVASLAGAWPKARVAAVALALMAFAAPANAQNDAPAAESGGPRNPMKGTASKDAKVSVSEHMTVDLHVKDEDLANVLELLSIETQKNIIASNKVGGKVTATLYGVTFYQALDSILHVNGYGYTENGNFIYVYTKEELAEIQKAAKKRISKVIKLNYLNAEDAKEFVSPLVSKEGGELKINTKTAAFTIPEKAPTGKNDYALSDTLVVIDFEENVKAVEELIKQIDTRPAQVLVEATILQTALNEANAFGVDFSVIGDLNFGDFVNIGGPLGAAAGLIKGGTGSAGQGFSPADDRGHAITSSPGNTSGPGTFKVGVLAGDVAIFLRMLDQVTDTMILSNPKILALNRQPARVLVGKRVGYLNTTSTETSTTQSVEFLDTGTQLYFRPFVSSEGEVRMELKPQVSAAEIRNVTNASGATVTIPDEVTQELVTNVNVRDGQTVVLGGLFTENTTFTRRQVPWAGDLPIIGAAFRGNEDQTTRSEIIFLITPTIVTDTMLAGAADRATGDIDRLRTGSRQQLLPWSREKMTDTLNVEAEKLAREGNFDKALWNIQRSLSLNPNQPEAYRLREKITGQRERWNTNSLLEDIVKADETKRLNQIEAPVDAGEHLKPRGSVKPVLEPAAAPRPMIPASAYMDEQRALATQAAALAALQASEQNATSHNVNAATTASSMPSTDASTATPANNQFAVTNTGETNTGSSSATTNLTVGDVNNAFTQSQPQPGSQFVSGTQMIDGREVEMVTASSSPVVAPASTEQPAMTVAPVSAPMAVTMPTDAAKVEHAAQSDMAKVEMKPEAKPADAKVEPKTVAYIVPTLNDAEKKQVGDVKDTLPGLRGHVELFALMNSGAMPELGKSEANGGWDALMNAELIKALPANTWVGGDNAQKVVVGEKPDTHYHNDYGWIYNPKTGQLWAASFDSTDRPLSKTTALEPLNANTATATNPPAPQPATPAASDKPQNPQPATVGVETDK